MIYDNDIDKCNDFITPSGDEYQIIYSPIVNKDGTIELIESGKRDIREEINSWRDHTDMAYVLRMMAAGQYIPREGAMYGDFTQVPSNMIDALQASINAERAFYDLPLDVRQKFNGDFRQWLAMMHNDSEKFSDLMGFTKPVENVKEGEEVVS